MPTPELLRIVGFDQSKEWPIPTWIVENASYNSPEPRCSECHHPSGPPPRMAFNGFDEYRLVGRNARAFFPNDENLIVLRCYAQELATLVSGIRPVSIVYSDWNQSRISVLRRWFPRPRLSVLAVIGHTTGGTIRDVGPIPLCPRCGASIRPLISHEDAGNLLPASATWDGSEVFTIRGLHRPFIIASAWSRLSEAGFSNLVVAPARWATHGGA